MISNCKHEQFRVFLWFLTRLYIFSQTEVKYQRYICPSASKWSVSFSEVEIAFPLRISNTFLMTDSILLSPVPPLSRNTVSFTSLGGEWRWIHLLGPAGAYLSLMVSCHVSSPVFFPPRLGISTYLASVFSVSMQLYLVVPNEMTKGDLPVILAVGFREKWKI